MERGDDQRVELPAALTLKLVHRGLDRDAAPVGPVGRERVEGVGDEDQARAEGDLRAGEAVRVAVPAHCSW